jgi:hypothetical protein
MHCGAIKIKFVKSIDHWNISTKSCNISKRTTIIDIFHKAQIEFNILFKTLVRKKNIILHNNYISLNLQLLFETFFDAKTI